ncbi:hypothetical protein [Novipirellula artificiosorum]|uniref:Shikimate dehydrogenase n=1 Tax=Novipirellula artificiosorum TaxID=2528016 RepID=A0A5C6DVS5_9BACT|nr:hypothetical protein [Novipirellula artificiosorum]TWU40748.1 hypothetical protein Poly41_15830 [Novipirellula artificiosorum]
MDGTTEPIIAVIGHPIAGNPSQFALERALASMRRDWRVLSFDVKPNDLAVALLGLEVLGVQGVLLDRALAREASRGSELTAAELQTETTFDCFYRDGEKRDGLIGFDAQKAWMTGQIEDHLENNKDVASCAVCVIGQIDCDLNTWLPEVCRERVTYLLRDDAEQFESETIANAGIVLIGKQALETAIMDWDDWMLANASALVIDFTDGYPLTERLAQSGRRVITPEQRHVGTLCQAMQKWLIDSPPTDVIHDAIEEYMAV